MDNPANDYYEFLQISPNADAETIHRVYRFLAARLHPDNHETGNEENFLLLKDAFDVLSDPHRRAEYDLTRARTHAPLKPLAATFDFMDVMEGESNRRLAVLAVLYGTRRKNPTYPEVPLSRIEERMGFPRDYLDFTLWYLHKKGYVTKGDSAQYALSVDGVDFVETQRANLPTLHKLLTAGTNCAVGDYSQDTEESVETADSAVTVSNMTPIRPEGKQSGMRQPLRSRGTIVLPSSMSKPEDRRMSRPDRRGGKLDLRDKKVERRFRADDRREELPVFQTTGAPLLARGDS